MKSLLNKYLLNGITFSPGENDGSGVDMGTFGETGGAGGGAGDGTGGAADTGVSNGTIFHGDGNDGDEDQADVMDFMAAFADLDEDGKPLPGGPAAVDDVTKRTGGLAEIPPAQVTAVENEVKSAISKMNLSVDMIPADFDPSNRQQLHALLNNVVKASVSNTMGVVFKPVQLAMAHMVSQLNSQMDSKLTDAQNGMQARSILETIVPEVSDEKMGPMVKNMDNLLKGRGKKPEERAKTIRKMLNQMGIKGNRTASNPGGGGSGGQPTVRHGKSALDSLFGKFTPPPTN